jgi:hypothetical protein
MAAGGSGGNGSGGSNAAGSGGSHGADGQSGSGGSGGVGAGGSGASISQRDDAGVAQDAGDSMADAAVANPAGCPATYAELAAMSSCSPPGVGCAYAEGYCSCVGYCGGAPPDPNVTPPPNMWSCVPLVKGCPIGPPTIGAACTDENQTCTYGACCIQLATCKKAAWSVGPLMCPP